MKQQINIRASKLTISQLEALMSKWGTSQTETLTVVIDRIYRQEKRTMSATTITQIWQHSTSGDRFAVKVYDGDTPRELWGPLDSEQVQEVIDTVRSGGDWTGAIEEAEQTQGYDAAQQMLVQFADTAGEYRTTWTEA